MVRKYVGLCVILLSIVVWLGIAHATASDWVKPKPSLAITEYMASNGDTLLDQDGDYSDWIELHNDGVTGVDLDGWYLTDNRWNRTKWRVPDVHLAAGKYLVVFASGKDRDVPGSELHTNFRLDSSGEYLALVEPNGKTIAWEYGVGDRGPQSAELVPQFQDVSYGLDAARNERYFVVPTPGRANGSVADDLGPILSDVRHAPSLPAADEPITVSVRVSPSTGPVEAVMLHYRIMYGDTHVVPMVDDGRQGDGSMGDGVYGAIIPSDVYRPGKMVRYYVTATDAQGHRSRWPLFSDPINSPEYQGTMIADPSSTSLLPVLYWFVQDPAAVVSKEGTRASVFYAGSGQPEGILYDNVYVRLRGYSAKRWPKKSLKIDFNQGCHFRYSADEDPVEEINLNTTYSDKAYFRQTLAWETYRDAGVPYCISFPVRVQQNGAFYGVFIYVEQPDRRYLARLGLDPNGALYKMKLFNALDSATEHVVKITRLDEDHGDLQSLVDGLRLPGEARTNYLFDHVDIPAIINYQATATIIQDRDQGHNNYLVYRDTEGTGEWTFLPWDKDLTFGMSYRGELSDIIAADQDPQSHPLSCYKNNELIAALFDMPATREMYLRRLRTLMDELLQPPDAHTAELYYERRIDELFTQMQLDVVRDAVNWPVAYGTPQTFAQSVNRLKTDYLAVRRVHLYDTHGPKNGGIIPDAQPATARVRFGSMRFVPRSGDRDAEYLILVNGNDYAVDISGWTIVGPVEYTFQPGVVIPSGGTLYVSPDVVAFRSRVASPTGGEGHFVQGDYRGRLSNSGGTLRLYNADGLLVASRFFVGLSLFNGALIAIALAILVPCGAIYGILTASTRV